MSAPLVFIIPVRHHGSVQNWSLLKNYITHTLASISAQTVPHWECIVVANEGADLPALPPRCRLVSVDLPVPDLPDRHKHLEAYYDAIRLDKGLRIYAGLRDIEGDSHVMVVDFDDFVSRRLAELVFSNREVSGWNFGSGYVWSGGEWCYLHTSFSEMCGTSHIIRRDLFGILECDNQPNIDAIKRRLGSHIFIHHDLAADGLPLEALPFPGAVYRIGNSQSTSGTGSLFDAMTPARLFLTRPRQTLRKLLFYRQVSKNLRKEFSLPES